MMIRIHKPRKPGRTPMLTCIRDDGSSTTAPITFGVEHDLIHYAVETELKLRDSFYALVARGWSIEDFNVPAATKRTNLPAEAGRTEFIVGLLQIERANGQPYADFNEQLALMSEQRGLKPPLRVDVEALRRIRARIDELCRAWLAAAPGAALELRFD